MQTPHRALVLVASVSLSSTTACSATDTSSFDGAGGGGGDATTGTTSTSSSLGGFGQGGGQGGGPALVAEVFGESPSDLYRLDPDTKQVSVVGSFSGCADVIDIALDKDSHLFGTTFDGLYAIDKTTAACSLIASGSYPNSLSFVPAGTVDPATEALVGYLGGDYVRIDPATGSVSTIGQLDPSYAYESSGDIVSVKNGKTLLTVKGPSCSDCIVEVDPKTGAMTKNWGSLPDTDFFGLAFWAGTAYGFTNGGQLVEIGFAGNSIQTSPIAVPNPPAGLQFWGAGSTTSAPPDRVPD